MSAEQTLAAYPGARIAVAYGELIVPWEDILPAVARGLTVPELLDVLEAECRERLAEADCPNPVQLRQVVEELRTPDFARYLNSKLGMM